MNRRTFLKAAGVSLALPCLESFGQIKDRPVKRLFTIVNHLGFYQPELIPTKEKPEPVLLKQLSSLKQSMKLYTAFDNPAVQNNNGHTPSVGILSGYFNKLQRKNRISVDQKAAELLGKETRFKSLCLQAGNNLNFSQVCWDQHGLPVYQIDSPNRAFELLFGVDKDHKEQKRILAEEKSILDMVYKQANSLSKKMTSSDKSKVDEYLTSVREVEKEVQRKDSWCDKAKPKTDYKLVAPVQNSVEDYLRVMLDLSRLAFQSDSTRVVTLQIPFWESFKHDDLTGSYHDLTHHGKKKEKIDKLLKIEKRLMKQFTSFINKMKQSSSMTGNLFEETSTLITSPMGSSNAHNFTDLPAIYINSDVKKFSSENMGNTPICDLYLSILNNLGLKLERFWEGKKTLELV